MRHRGGGWYELADGTVVQGKAKAEQAETRSRDVPAGCLLVEVLDGQWKGRIRVMGVEQVNALQQKGRKLRVVNG